MAVDLTTLGQCLRLDHLAVQASTALQRAGVPHAVIQGVTTARWLYPDGARRYRDVDLLIPAGALQRATSVLVEAGVVRCRRPRFGESAPHSLLLTSTAGAEIDLHVSLPADPHPVSDRLWTALATHREPFDIDGTEVPGLDVPARCLVLAMHLLANGGAAGQARQDLERARHLVDVEVWRSVQNLADELDLTHHLAAAVAVVDNREPGDTPHDVRLRLDGARGAALQWDRIRRLPWHRRVLALGSEAFPSPAFMAATYPRSRGGPHRLVAAYLARWGALVREVDLRTSAPTTDRGSRIRGRRPGWPTRLRR